MKEKRNKYKEKKGISLRKTMSFEGSEEYFCTTWL